jgi:hypothetical protein
MIFFFLLLTLYKEWKDEEVGKLVSTESKLMLCKKCCVGMLLMSNKREKPETRTPKTCLVVSRSSPCRSDASGVDSLGRVRLAVAKATSYLRSLELSSA